MYASLARKSGESLEYMRLTSEYGVIARKIYGIERTRHCHLVSIESHSISAGNKSLLTHLQASGLMSGKGSRQMLTRLSSRQHFPTAPSKDNVEVEPL